MAFNPPLIDDFNRPDAPSLGTASVSREIWTEPAYYYYGATGMAIVSNAAVGEVSGGSRVFSARLANDRAQNVSVAGKVKALPAGSAVVVSARLVNAGTPAEDVYSAHFQSDLGFYITESIDGTDTQITPVSGSEAVNLSPGDYGGMQIVEGVSGTNLTIYTKIGAGAWTLQASYLQTTVGRPTGAGKVAIHTLNDITAGWDEFYADPGPLPSDDPPVGVLGRGAGW